MITLRRLLILSMLAAPFSARAEWDATPFGRAMRLGRGPEKEAVGFLLMEQEATGIRFTNTLSEAGAAKNRILENGSGVALGDVDGDGLCDVFLARLEGPCALFRNLGGWRFEEVPNAGGASCAGQFSTGAVFADLDGDGDLDLLVNGIGAGTRLFINDGAGKFTERKDSGLIPRFGACSMTLADVDGDGDLDLYVTNYRTTTTRDNPDEVKVQAKKVGDKIVVTPEDRFEAVVPKGEGVMLVEKGEADILYLNDGGGHFGAVSWTGGFFQDEEGRPLTSPPRDWGLSAMFHDINGDGWQDLYVCNDFLLSPDRIWLNRAGKGFRAASRLTVREISMSSMSVDFADINRDGFDDFFVVDMLSRDPKARHRQRANLLKGDVSFPTHDPLYRPEVIRNTLHLNRGDGTFAEISQLAGLDATEWSWSAIFLDVDLDGYEDLLVATGNNHDVLDVDAIRTSQERIRSGDPSAPRGVAGFPRLNRPLLAFRNQGDLTFKETGKEWGFNSDGIANGMALADLDNDGDLDVVINRLNGPAQLLRNDSTAPRIAVRLRGRGPNTRAAGARIEFIGAGKPQSQTVLSGGRYLSSDQGQRTFAAPNASPVELRITWPDRTVAVLTNLAGNTLVEVSQEKTPQAQASAKPSAPAPLFQTVPLPDSTMVPVPDGSDFERSPWLTHMRAGRHTGLAWVDLDGDGRLDLVIAQGTRLSGYTQGTSGGFTPVNLPQPEGGRIIGEIRAIGTNRLATVFSNEADAKNSGPILGVLDLPTRKWSLSFAEEPSSCAVLAVGDMDGDGQPDFFVGGAGVPGRWPQPGNSRLFLSSQGDKPPSVFKNLGMVSAALFTDMDGDGDLDLVVACEWQPVRVFLNDKGRISEATSKLGLGGIRGWWTALAAGDFDGDGRTDIVAGNWGRNTRYQAWIQRPLTVHYGALPDGGWLALESAENESGHRFLWRDLGFLQTHLPRLAERFTSYREYGDTEALSILEPIKDGVRAVSVNTLDAMLFLNKGDHFEPLPLPVEAQFAPVLGVAAADFNGDGKLDLFLSQNFFGTERETARYDAGLGLVLLGDGKGGFTPQSTLQSGVNIPGEQRAVSVVDFDGDGESDLTVIELGRPVRLYKNKSPRH